MQDASLLRRELFVPLVAVISPMVGGLGVGFFGCLLSFARRAKHRHGGHTRRTRCAWLIAMAGSFVFSFFSVLPLALGAPINTVNVVRAGTLLPSNAFFSQFFGLRPLVREDYVGTLITLGGVVCFLMFVGPPHAEWGRDEFLHQIGRPLPVAFNLAILALFCSSACWMGLQRSRARSLPLSIAVSVVISCSIAAMDVATKGWSAGLRSPAGLGSSLFWVALLLQASFFIISKWGMIYGCSRCDVLVFVPLNIVLNITFAVAAGMVVLGEAAQVPNAKCWFGLSASWLCVIGGIVTLVSGPAQRQDEVRNPSSSARHDDGESTEEEMACCWRLIKRTLITKSNALERLNREHSNAAHFRKWVLKQLTQRFSSEHTRSDSAASSDDSDSSETLTEDVC